MRNFQAHHVVSILILFVAQMSIAASAARVDAKKVLNIVAGNYLVTSADTAVDDDNFCVKGASHTIRWAGSGDDLVLGFGNSRIYQDFNNGLRTDTIPEDKQKCKFQHSTQAEDGRLIDDSFTNCLNENTTTHTEILVKGTTMEYSSKMKISRDGKVVEVPAKCSLKKIEKNAAAKTPAPLAHEANHSK